MRPQMPLSVRSRAAEWRTREADSRVPGLALPGPDAARQPGISPESPNHPAKRQKVVETGGEAGKEAATDGQETRERVPIARSSMSVLLIRHHNAIAGDDRAGVRACPYSMHNAAHLVQLLCKVLGDLLASARGSMTD